MKLKIALCSALATLAMNVHAVVIPAGLQADVTDADIAAWGWTECHRSDAGGIQSSAAVLSACAGTHLAMGVWDSSRSLYGVVGMGEYDVVSAFTYQYYRSGLFPNTGSSNPESDDDVGGVLNNWSNGLNWYRTEGHGSWGFTTIDTVQLNSADVNLSNTFGPPAAGLSFHTHGDVTGGPPGGDLSAGWCYNATGSSQTCFSSGDDRVFWLVNAAEAPEPATLAMLALGLAGAGFGQRARRRQP